MAWVFDTPVSLPRARASRGRECAGGLLLAGLAWALAGCGDVGLLGPTTASGARVERAQVVVSSPASADAARPALQAALGAPVAVVAAPDGSLYVAEQQRSLVRRISAAGTVSIVAGTGSPVSPVVDAVTATLSGLEIPRGLALDADGNLYISQVATSFTTLTLRGGRSTFDPQRPGEVTSLVAGRIRRVDAVTGVITTVAGQGPLTQDGVFASASSLLEPEGLVADGSGNLYVAETGRNRVRVLRRRQSPDASLGFTIDTVLGPPGPQDRQGVRTGTRDDFPPSTPSDTLAGRPATSVRIRAPIDVTLDAAGNLYVAELAGRILVVDRLGIANVFDAPAQAALEVRCVLALGDSLFAAGGGVLWKSSLALRDRKLLTPGPEGFAGDGFSASAARFEAPSDLTTAFGRLVLADAGNNRIRSVELTSQLVGSLAGKPDLTRLAASQARFGRIRSSALWAPGSLQVVVGDSGAIRQVERASGSGALEVVTVAGDGAGGDSGDGAAATAARLGAVTGVVVAAADALPTVAKGDVFFCDAATHRVRVLRKATGLVEAVAGTGLAGQQGDGGLAVAARLNAPSALALDASGNLFIADTGNQALRKVNRFGVISTLIATSPAAGRSEAGLAPSTSPRLGKLDALAVSPDGTRIATVDNTNPNSLFSGRPLLIQVDGLGRVESSQATTEAGVAGLATDSLGRLYLLQVASSPSGTLATSVSRRSSLAPGASARQLFSAAELPTSFSRADAFAVEPDGRRLWLSNGTELAFKNLSGD
ncbi:MAG: hypothetical protein HYY25_03490 [Candidatus Wallbacteria bacterium]|nr:hypothetical protein [Candidatus Wallbacteria bacterium]